MRPAWAPQNKLGGQLLNLTLYILGPLDLWLTLRAAATDMPNRPIPTQSTTECSAPGLLDRASGHRPLGEPNPRVEEEAAARRRPFAKP